MPDTILEVICRPALEFVFEPACYWVGRIFVPLVSFGYVRGEPLSFLRRPVKVQCFGLFFRGPGFIYLTHDGTTFAGLILILGVSAVLGLKIFNGG